MPDQIYEPPTVNAPLHTIAFNTENYGPMTFFSAHSATIDGRTTRSGICTRSMFELFEDGDSACTAGYRHQPGAAIDEQQWLRCGEIVDGNGFHYLKEGGQL